MANPIPQHVAIIMDGNGRWAKQQGKPRSFGHKNGADAVRRAMQAAGDMGVKYLTLYAFSSENWQRPKDEVSDLMGLLKQYLKRERKHLYEKQVALKIIGNRQKLPDDIQKLIEDIEQNPPPDIKLTMVIALSYGSREEIVAAVNQAVEKGEMVNEESFEQYLYTTGIPSPDLLIRTSGEQRLSNFLLWQLAYAEFVFLNVLWPDFDKNHFEEAIEIYQTRERRYGGR